MKHFINILAVLCLACPGILLAADSSTSEDAPVIVHAPVTTVLRGQPAHIVAKITPGDGVITSVTTQVKLTLAGKPIVFPMKLSSDDKYGVDVPVSLIKGINRFWYFIDVRDNKGHISDTIWFEVRIIDATDTSGGGAGRGNNNALWIGGGVLVAGGVAAAIIANNDNGGGGHDDPPDDSSKTTTKKKNSSSGGGGDSGGGTDPEPDPNTAPPCVLTGNERVSYSNLDPDFKSGPTDIEILVCDTCPDANISASGSWGVFDSISGYNNPTCASGNPSLTLTLRKPGSTPSANSETINVFSNGQLIDSITWPPFDNF